MNKIFKSFLVLSYLVHLINGQQNCNGPIPHVKPSEICCEHPALFSSADWQNCGHHPDHHSGQVASSPTAAPTPTAVSGYHFHGSCGIECLFNMTGSYSGNGVVNQASALSTFTQAFNGHPGLTTDLTTAVNSCFSTATNNAAKLAALYAAEPSHCNPITAYLLICIRRNLIAGCPSDKFNNADPECLAVKEYVTACPMTPL